MEFHFEQGEMLLISKPFRWTSFDVVGKTRSLIRKATGVKVKIGHAGTLDPLATGLLILCTGRMTKKIEDFQGMEKEYTGTFRLGATTPSYDLETEIDTVFEGALPDEETIRKAVGSFIGDQDQVPPQFSAIKVDGKRVYESARRDIPVEISPRQISVPLFEITKIQMPYIDFRVVCSKGTYIRALARDLGNRLGCGAHMTALCRTRIGPYTLDQAFSMDELTIRITGTAV